MQSICKKKKIDFSNSGDIVRPEALQGWLWPGMVQSPCAVHPAHTHTPAWQSTVGQPTCYIALDPDDNHVLVLFLGYG